MKILLKAFMALIMMNSSYALSIKCEAVSSQVDINLKGEVNLSEAKLKLSGSSLFDQELRLSPLTFERSIRTQESSYAFAKYSASTLFNALYFSLPKDLFQSSKTSFKAYLTLYREGIGGRTNELLNCSKKKAMNNSLMSHFIQEYRNLITLDHINEEDREFIHLIHKIDLLPSKILKALNHLNLNLLNDWDTISSTESEYVINFSENETTDAFEVINQQKETVGYIFNVTQCNPEECYGWDALYLDVEGNLLFKSF
ncbi:MAG: hypothetical protein CME60_10220 [Halobacteriovoraceae bacterium]|nr:hypothetical protein [Halobacteriovoraceae bacterium]